MDSLWNAYVTWEEHTVKDMVVCVVWKLFLSFEWKWFFSFSEHRHRYFFSLKVKKSIVIVVFVSSCDFLVLMNVLKRVDIFYWSKIEWIEYGWLVLKQNGRRQNRFCNKNVINQNFENIDRGWKYGNVHGRCYAECQYFSLIPGWCWHS